MKYICINSCLLFFLINPTWARDIAIYTYHNKPPLVEHFNKEQGLYFDFIRLLNKENKR